MSEFIVKQHPPFYVSDQRAIYTCLWEFKLDALDQLTALHDHLSTERQTIMAYVLKLYTGMTLKQTCEKLKLPYGATQIRINELVSKVSEFPHSNAAKTLNNIINNL